MTFCNGCNSHEALGLQIMDDSYGCQLEAEKASLLIELEAQSQLLLAAEASLRLLKVQMKESGQMLRF